MSNDIVTLPTTAHVSVVRQFIERERSMRNAVLKGEKRLKGVEDANRALASLNAIEEAIRAK